MATYRHIRSVNIKAFWNSSQNDPVDVSIKLQIHTTPSIRFPIFHRADEHVGFTLRGPHRVTDRATSAQSHSSEIDKEESTLGLRHNSCNDDVDIDDPSTVELETLQVLARTPSASEDRVAAPIHQYHPEQVHFIDLSLARRESSDGTIDIHLPSKPSSLIEGIHDDTYNNSGSFEQRGEFGKGLVSSSSPPEPVALTIGNIAVRKRGTRESSKKQSSHTTPKQSRVLTEVRHNSQSFRSSRGTKLEPKSTPKRPQWQSPSQSDFFSKENRTSSAKPRTVRDRSNTVNAIQPTPTSQSRATPPTKTDLRTTTQVPESPNNPSSKSADSPLSLERITKWQTNCLPTANDDCMPQSTPTSGKAPWFLSLGNTDPTNSPGSVTQNKSPPFIVEESGTLWAVCPSDVEGGIFEIEMTTEIQVSKTLDCGWQSLQITGLPRLDKQHVKGHIMFDVAADESLIKEVQFDTSTLENGLTNDRWLSGEFALDSPLRLLFRLKHWIHHVQNYHVRCDLQAIFNWTSIGVWAVYKAAVELPVFRQDIFAECLSITLCIRDGSKEMTAYCLNPGNQSISLSPTEKKNAMELEIRWDPNETTLLANICFDMFLGRSSGIVNIPTISASSQNVKVEQGIRFLEPMLPLLVEFPLYCVPVSHQHVVKDSAIGRIHEFSKKNMPRTFPIDLESGLKAIFSTLEPAVFSDGEGITGAGIHVMQVTLRQVMATNALECELSLGFLVKEDAVNREVLSFANGNWTPAIAFINDKMASNGQFYYNTKGELALFRATKDLQPGQWARVVVIWRLDSGLDDTQLECELPRLLNKPVLRSSLACNIRGASMVSFDSNHPSTSHRFDEGHVLQLPHLHAGYRLVIGRSLGKEVDQPHLEGLFSGNQSVFENLAGESVDSMFAREPSADPFTERPFTRRRSAGRSWTRRPFTATDFTRSLNSREVENQHSGSRLNDIVSGLDVSPSRPRKKVRFAMDEQSKMNEQSETKEQLDKVSRSSRFSMILTALFSVLLLSAVAGTVGYLGFVGQGRCGTRLHFSGYSTSNISQDNDEINTPMPSESAVLSVDNGPLVADVTTKLQHDDSPKQEKGLRDMIDYALGWREGN